MPTTTTSVHLARRPAGLPDEDTWDIRQSELPDQPDDGKFIVAVDHISLDPAMRGWLNDARSYIRPVQVGEVMRANATGTVIASRHPDFRQGQAVAGTFGVTEHAISDGTGVTVIDTDLAHAPTWLGALSIPGFTAYFGLHDVGKLRSGDTVVISGAAGAVGSVAGQLAKAQGCRVIGIAGGEQKCQWLREVGFDEAVDYKSESVLKRLRELAPDGVDVFFDNVGGETLDAGLANLRRGARVVICGAISSYNETTLPPGPSRYLSLLVFRATMEGFVVFDYADRYPEAVKEIGKHIAEGTLTARETVLSGGVTAFNEAFQALFTGVNTGKLVLKLD